MKLAEPKVGSVIRYSYLWADEASTGAREGRKDRPVLTLALVVRRHDGETEVMVLPITHARPRHKSDAVEMSATVRTDLGFDDEPAWIVTTEANIFVWPGPDLRLVPGRKSRTPIYGRIPPAILRIVARSYLDNRARQARAIRREI